MIDLQECRDEIDVIDSEIIRLFEKRMKVCEDVAEYKIRTGKKVLDPERERKKLEVLREKAHGEFNRLGAQELFQQIMAISRKRQYQLLNEHGVEDDEKLEMVDHLPLENVTVVFQGVEGAYSYAAMREYFSDEIRSFHVKTWRDAMEEVAEGRADYAVLPIENSTAGIVAGIYDLLAEYDLSIVGEQIIRPEHVLLGMPDASLEDITCVCSHPQALAQSQVFLLNHFPTVDIEQIGSTAQGAKKVADHPEKKYAAIGSKTAAKQFGLTIVKENIQSVKENETRFWVLGTQPLTKALPQKKKKATILFDLDSDHPGALYKCLAIFSAEKINLTKIESRTQKTKLGEYFFIIDLETPEEEKLQKVLQRLKEQRFTVTLIGNYPTYIPKVRKS